jgi:hypothetical protein
MAQTYSIRSKLCAVSVWSRTHVDAKRDHQLELESQILLCGKATSHHVPCTMNGPSKTAEAELTR